MYTGLHVKYTLFLSGFDQHNFLDIFSKSTQILNFKIICPVGAELFHADEQRASQPARQTNRHDKVNSCYFAVLWTCLKISCFSLMVECPWKYGVQDTEKWVLNHKLEVHPRVKAAINFTENFLVVKYLASWWQRSAKQFQSIKLVLDIKKKCRVHWLKNNLMKLELSLEQIKGNLNPASGTWIHFWNLQVGSNNDETVNTNVILFVTNHACI